MGYDIVCSTWKHVAGILPVNFLRELMNNRFKHKQGFVENEESRRYVSDEPTLFIPEYRLAPEGSIKQGSGGDHPENNFLKKIYYDQCMAAIREYNWLVHKKGVAPEQARLILPQGVEVQWIWTGNLASYARFYGLRTDSHAQKEVQDLAEMVGKIIEPLFPVSWKALTQG